VKVWIFKGEVAGTRAEREAQAAVLAQAGNRNRPTTRGRRSDRPDRRPDSPGPEGITSESPAPEAGTAPVAVAVAPVSAETPGQEA
jgi:small subunit ribosomal protein S3